MKCPKCSKNHKKALGLRCPCGYEFALDPKIYGMADGKLLSYVRRASANDTLYFTQTQLLTAASRIDKFGAFCSLIAGLALVAAGLTFCLKIFPFQIIGGFVGFILICAGLYKLLFSRPDREKLFTALDKYQSKYGKFEKLIDSPQLDSAPENNFEPDLFDYGVERVLIVQRPIIVDLLVLNKVHVQTRSLIMGAEGYPKYLVDNLNRILEDSPSLPVFFLHDSTPAGIAWVEQQLNSPQFNNGTRNLIDMGIGADDIQRLKRLNGLRLQRDNYSVPVDVIPMAMLVNGIMVSMEQEISLSQIIAAKDTSDAYGNFG